MHDLLYAHQGELDIEDLIGYAAHLDMDVDGFVAEIREGRNSARIREDAAAADASGAQSTPTFFIGDWRHTGPYDAVTLAAELRDRAKRGTRASLTGESGFSEQSCRNPARLLTLPL